MFFIQVVQGNYCEAAGIGNQPLLNVFCVNELGASEGASMRSASLGDDGSVKLVVMRQGTLDEMEGTSLGHPFSAVDLFSGYSLDGDANGLNTAIYTDPDAVAAASAAVASAAYSASSQAAGSSSSGGGGRKGASQGGSGDARGVGGVSSGVMGGSSNGGILGGARSSGVGGGSAEVVGGGIDYSLSNPSPWLTTNPADASGYTDTAVTPAEIAAAAASADPSLLEDPVVHWAMPSWEEGISVKVMSKRRALGNMLKGYANCDAPYASLTYHHAFSQVFAEITRGGGGDDNNSNVNGGDEDRGGATEDGCSDDNGETNNNNSANTGAQVVVGSDLGLSEATLMRIAALVSEVATMLDFPNNRPHLRVVLSYFRKLALERDLSFLAQAQSWNCSRKRSVYLNEDLLTVANDMTRRVQQDVLNQVSNEYPSSNDPRAKADEVGISLGGCCFPSYSAVLFGSRLVAETDGDWCLQASVRNGIEKKSLLGRLFNNNNNQDGGSAAGTGGGGGLEDIAGDAAERVREEDSGRSIWHIDRFIFQQIAAAFHAMPSCRAGYLTPAEWRIQRLEFVLHRFGISRHNVSQQRQRLFLMRYLNMLRRSSPIEIVSSSLPTPPPPVMITSPSQNEGGEGASSQPLTLRAKSADHEAADTYEYYFRELFHLCSDVQGVEVGGGGLEGDREEDTVSRRSSIVVAPSSISAVIANGHGSNDDDDVDRGGDTRTEMNTESRGVSTSYAGTREASPILDEVHSSHNHNNGEEENFVAATENGNNIDGIVIPSPAHHQDPTKSSSQQLLAPPLPTPSFNGNTTSGSLSSTRNTSSAQMTSLGRASHSRRSVRQSNVNAAADVVVMDGDFGGGGTARGDVSSGQFYEDSSKVVDLVEFPATTSSSMQHQSVQPPPQLLSAREHLLQQRRYYSGNKSVAAGNARRSGVEGSSPELEYTHLFPKRHSYHDPCRYHSTFFVGDEHAESYSIDLDQLDCIPDQLSTTIKGVLLRGRDRADATLVIDWIESPEVPETVAAAAACPDGFGIILLYSGSGGVSDVDGSDEAQDQLATLQHLDDDALDHLGKCILTRFPSSFHQVQWLTSPLVASYNVPGLIHFLSVNRRVNTSVAGNFDAEIHSTSTGDNDTLLGLHMMHELMANNVSRAHDLMANGFSEGLWGHLGVQFFYCVTHMPTRGQLKAVFSEQEASVAAASSMRPSAVGPSAGGRPSNTMMDASYSTSAFNNTTDTFGRSSRQGSSQVISPSNNSPSPSGSGGLLPPKRSGLFNTNNKTNQEDDRSQFTKSFVLDAGVYSPNRGYNQQPPRGSSSTTTDNNHNKPSSSKNNGSPLNSDGSASSRYATLGGTSFLLSDTHSSAPLLLPSTLQQLCYRPSFIPDCNDTPVLEFYGLFVGCMSPVEVCAAAEHLFAKLYL